MLTPDEQEERIEAFDQYKNSKRAECFRKYGESRNVVLERQLILEPSIHRLLNYDLRGKRVLDMACGSGDSTRLLADLEPDEIVGADISHVMIDMALASQRSSSDPRYARIEYVVRDCSKPLVGLGLFDLVFSKHYLNYAHDQNKLLEMVRSMYESTKPGGECAGVMANPFAADESHFRKYHKYNVERKRVHNGAEIVSGMYDGPVGTGTRLADVKFWLWPHDFYEKCFDLAGFANFEWVDFHLEASEPECCDFFKDYFNPSIHIMFKATRK